MTIRKCLFAASLALGLTSAGLLITGTTNAAEPYTLQFTADGELIRPADGAWRDWIYIGAIVTPNALNDGDASFPEFHSVYVEPRTWEHYVKTGEFMDGAIIAKELGLIYSVDANPDGSTTQVSGTGYFMGESFSGFEITVKSKEHYPDEPGNWAYFTYGHHAPPYAMSAPALPTEACNGCHEAAAAEDFVFTQFYPVLRAAKP